MGLNCHFAWPVLWKKDDAVICSAHPDGPRRDFIGEGIMPKMCPRSDAIRELDANWDRQAHIGLVPTALERALCRP